MSERISTLSTQYVRVPLTQPADADPFDPTGDTVELAFTAVNVLPVVDDWIVGSWEVGGPPYIARALVGPDGGTVLAVGEYDVWVRFTPAAETVVLESGRLTVGDDAATVVTPGEVAEALGVTFTDAQTAAAQSLIDGLQAEAESLMNRDLSVVSVTETTWNESPGGNLFLRRRPVVAVQSVTVDDGFVPITQFGSYLVWPWGIAGISPGRVTVTYTAGLDPALNSRIVKVARAQILKAAARQTALGSAGMFGYSRIAVEGESVEASGGSTTAGDDPQGFSAAEQKILGRLRRRVAYSGVTGYAGGYLIGSDL